MRYLKILQPALVRDNVKLIGKCRVTRATQYFIKQDHEQSSIQSAPMKSNYGTIVVQLDFIHRHSDFFQTPEQFPTPAFLADFT